MISQQQAVISNNYMISIQQTVIPINKGSLLSQTVYETWPFITESHVKI